MTTEQRLKILQALKGNQVSCTKRKDTNKYIYYHTDNKTIKALSAVLETPFGDQVKEFHPIIELDKNDDLTITWNFDLNGTPVDLPKDFKCWIIYRQ